MMSMPQYGRRPQLHIDKLTLIKNSPRTRKIRDVYSFTKSDKLGQGSYGTVYRSVHNATQLVRAIKVIEKEKTKHKERLEMEVRTMQELDHPHIVRLYEYYEDEDYLYMVQELCSGGDVFDKVLEIGNFTEEGAQTLFIQIIRCVNYYSYFGVVHRDLKPENFLFAKKEDITSLYMIDFGLAKKYKPGMPKLTTKAGTAYYVAPEVLNGCYDNKCDIWSIGVILYVLCCGYPPFYGETEKEVLLEILTGNFQFDGIQNLSLLLIGVEWETIGESVKELICYMITKEDVRYTVDDVLKHPWVKSYIDLEAAKNQQFSKTLFSKRKLQQFAGFSLLKQVSLLYMAVQIDQEKLKQYKKAFIALNTSQSGFISLAETINFFKCPQSEIEEVTNLFYSCDFSSTNSLSYSEFIAICLTDDIFLADENIMLSFIFFQSMEGPYIDAHSLLACLSSDSEAPDLSVISSIMTRHDINNDGKIDFQEFTNALKI